MRHRDKKDHGRMHIYIPSYHRADRQKTLSMMPPSVMWRTTLVVSLEDYEEGGYREVIKQYGCTVWIHPTNRIKSIAQKRAWIIKRTPYERILMLDDDLRFCQRHKREDGEGFSQLNATPHEVLVGLRRIEKKLRKFAHVGISPKQGNNNYKERWWRPNARMIYGLGYRPEVLRRRCKLGRIEHREDMDYCLQMLRKGYENRVLLDLCVDQVYNAPGGASEERTMKASNRDAERLAELHPGLVKVVSKKYKVVIDRKEVVCSWRKAIEIGKSRHHKTPLYRGQR